jgi:hypothetical protein
MLSRKWPILKRKGGWELISATTCAASPSQMASKKLASRLNFTAPEAAIVYASLASTLIFWKKLWAPKNRSIQSLAISPTPIYPSCLLTVASQFILTKLEGGGTPNSRMYVLIQVWTTGLLGNIHLLALFEFS